MNVKSILANLSLQLAVNSVASSSSESLPNDGEKPHQPKFQNVWGYGRALSNSSHSSVNLCGKNGCTGKTGGFCKSINPVLSTIKLLK